MLSYNAAHSTLMTRVVLKKNSTDFVVTGAQSGVMYVSGLPVEKNVFVGVRRKIATFAAAFELLHGLSGEATIVTGSSADLHLPDESVDYVFTDPPFGGYIPYSEINQVNELWLGQTTQTEDEAIISPAQGKGVGEYQSAPDVGVHRGCPRHEANCRRHAGLPLVAGLGLAGARGEPR